MKTIHLPQCDSTQTYLKEALQKLRDSDPGEKNILVSTSRQTKGRGRAGNRWDHYSHSLAFSFTLSPHPNLTLTAAEMGVQVAHFFESRFKKELRLKWPNDLMNGKGQKCGGILIQYIDEGTLIIGIGINLCLDGVIPPPADYKFPGGGIFEDVEELNLLSHSKSNENFNGSKEEIEQALPELIYGHVLRGRMGQEETIREWNRLCVHSHSMVRIADGASICEGRFEGLGSEGEALVGEGASMRKVLTGSLYLL